jgi:hypothetical protein
MGSIKFTPTSYRIGHTAACFHRLRFVTERFPATPNRFPVFCSGNTGCTVSRIAELNITFKSIFFDRNEFDDNIQKVSITFFYYINSRAFPCAKLIKTINSFEIIILAKYVSLFYKKMVSWRPKFKKFAGDIL